MSNEESLILALCRKEKACLITLLEDSYINGNDLLKLLVKHKIAPLILDRLLRYPLPGQLKLFLISRYKQEIRQAFVDNQIIRKELSGIKIVLESHQIDFMLIKGLSLDSSNLRTTGDLDLLIKAKDLLKAIRVLEQIQYVYRGNELNHLLTARERKNIRLQMAWNNQYQLFNKTSGLCLELHINLFERERVYVEELDTLLDNVDCLWKEKVYKTDLQCYELSPEHSLLLMCLQTALKKSPANQTFILRNVIDMANLIQSDLDWDKIVDLAASWKVVPFIFFALGMTKKLMKSPIPVSALNSLKKRMNRNELFLTRVHFKVLKSLHAFSRFYSFLYLLLKPFIFARSWKKAWKARLKSLCIVPWLFPPRWRLALLFRLKPASPLLPFVYLLHPLRGIYLLMRDAIRMRG